MKLTVGSRSLGLNARTSTPSSIITPILAAHEGILFAFFAKPFDNITRTIREGLHEWSSYEVIYKAMEMKHEQPGKTERRVMTGLAVLGGLIIFTLLGWPLVNLLVR